MNNELRIIYRLPELYDVLDDGLSKYEQSDPDFIAKIAESMPDDELRTEFNRRAACYVIDLIFFRFVGEPCLLFSDNWRSEAEALEQMLRSGLGLLESQRIAQNGPYSENAIDDEIKTVVRAMLGGFLLRPRPAEVEDDKPRRKWQESCDYSASDVAQILRISRENVVKLIETGVLNGCRVDVPGSKRPTWRITRKALAEFRERRNGKAPVKISQKKNRPSSGDIEYF